MEKYILFHHTLRFSSNADENSDEQQLVKLKGMSDTSAGHLKQSKPRCDDCSNNNYNIHGVDHASKLETVQLCSLAAEPVTNQTTDSNNYCDDEGVNDESIYCDCSSSTNSPENSFTDSVIAHQDCSVMTEICGQELEDCFKKFIAGH